MEAIFGHGDVRWKGSYRMEVFLCKEGVAWKGCYPLVFVVFFGHCSVSKKTRENRWQWDGIEGWSSPSIEGEGTSERNDVRTETLGVEIVLFLRKFIKAWRNAGSFLVVILEL